MIPRRLPLALASLALACCGKAPGDPASMSSPATTQANGNQSPTGTATTSVVSGDTPDSPGSTVAKNPSAADLAGNPESEGQLAGSALSAAADAAATGGAGSTGGASLMLAGLGLDTTSQPSQSATGEITAQDCYLGAGLHARSGSTLAWPESTDPASAFYDSKDSPTDATLMYEEPSLVQYPAVAPTASLQVTGAPFAFKNLLEVILDVNGQSQVTLADLSKTSVTQNGKSENHRFWVPKTGAAACGPVAGADAKGTSGAADGRWFRIKWSDDAQVNGVSLLERIARTWTQAKTYYPLRKGVPANSTVTINTAGGMTGSRLVQWTTSTDVASAVAGAADVRQKVITHSFQIVDQLTDGSGNVESDLSHLEEVRANAPLTLLEYRDANDNPLAQVVESGTVYMTASDADGVVHWFSTMEYSNVKFDLVNSSDPCVPISGAATLSIYSAEGGTPLRKIAITYTSTLSQGNATKVDPALTVTGSADDSTEAQWMMLHINRKCDLRG